jgi:ATP-dependent DNA helicase UvrD/PcrA
MDPTQLEEERRLCYVGMTRAMDALVLTRARFRRRYGTDMPDATIPSRFLEEVPSELIQDLGAPRDRGTPSRSASTGDGDFAHDRYDDDFDQRPRYATPERKKSYGGETYNSIDNIADFFASRGKKFSRPKIDLPSPTGKTGFRPGMKVRHPKYGEGTVFKREGEGEDAKITVQFPRFGLKKLVEKFAQLERA